MPEKTVRPDATAELTAALADRILVIDGAMGTLIQGHGLGEEEYRGAHFGDHHRDLKGNSDLLSVTAEGVSPYLLEAWTRRAAEDLSSIWSATAS